jgi:Dockerin type I domain
MAFKMSIALRNRLTIACSICTLLIASAPSMAVQLYYDPFDIGPTPAAGQYAVGALNGQNPSVGTQFMNGAWFTRTAGEEAGANVQATGLSYLGAPSRGGAEMSTPNASPARNLAVPWTDATATNVLPDGVTPNPSGAYYVGFEVSFGAGDYSDGYTNNDIGYRPIELFNSSGSFLLGVGYNGFNGTIPGNDQPKTGRMVLDTSNSITGSGGGSFPQIIGNSPLSFVEDGGVTHLIVLKFSLSATAGQDSVSAFLDPTDASEPVIAGAVLTGANITLGGIGGARINGGSGTFPVFDELRIGTSFADAVPVFPTPGDTNGDMLVDQIDYLNIFHTMNLTGAAIPNTPTNHPDVNGDGKITLADFRIWKDHRTDLGAGAGAASAIVPEPTSLNLVLLAAAMVAVSSARNWPNARGGEQVN